MKTKLALSVAAGLLAGAVAAQDPAPQTKPERPVLNLKLDEGGHAAPRITFTPRDPLVEKAPASTLPTLGGPARSFDPPSGSGTKPDYGAASPFPKDTSPNH